jgi:hypothetical protein
MDDGHGAKEMIVVVGERYTLVRNMKDGKDIGGVHRGGLNSRCYCSKLMFNVYSLLLSLCHCPTRQTRGGIFYGAMSAKKSWKGEC